MWSRLGDVNNFIEPMVGSGAVLLARPHPPCVETINDKDCHITNVFRALKYDPEGVAEWADFPVDECMLHSEHRWLVGVPSVPPGYDTPYLRAMYLHGMLDSGALAFVRDAALFRHRMRTEPDYYDVKRAGRWLHGCCCWIGGGFCVDPDHGAVNGPVGGSGERMPHIQNQPGNGVHAKGKKPPVGLSQQMPDLGSGRTSRFGCGVIGSHEGHRPQLADAYSRGRGVHNDNHLREKIPLLSCARDVGQGVHGNGTEDTCAQRRAWLCDWFSRLRDRLRTVRVCSGRWERVCDSESVTVRLGTTGIFFDPPYLTHQDDGTESRSDSLYATDGSKESLVKIRDDLLAYCLERGSHPKMRLCVAAYEGDGYERLLKHGWDVIAWRTAGGYGNRSAKGKKNAGRERLFFSQNCLKGPAGLFDGLE